MNSMVHFMPTILRNSEVKIGFKITLPILTYHETDTCTSKNQWFYQKKALKNVIQVPSRV